MKPIIMTKIALDTNILIYNHFLENERKRAISQELLLKSPFISTQTISEYLNTMKRLLKSVATKADLMDLCAEWMSQCVICPIDIATVKLAKQLIQRYDFQLFDSIIVASALEADCEILYSEDMQHNMKVNKQLKIFNPFLQND